jgi:hypothetical protein
MQGEGIEQSFQVMVTVRSPSEHIKAQIHLAIGEKNHRYKLINKVVKAPVTDTELKDSIKGH